MAHDRDIQKSRRVFLWLLFAVYGLFLVYILFFWSERDGQIEQADFSYYMEECFNLIPFRTIVKHTMCMVEEGYYMRRWAARNLFGNLILFYPMGLLLPCLFRKLRTLRQNIWLSFRLILSVEVVQMLLFLGFFDIDDLILNMTGWIFGFLTLSIPLVRRFLVKLCFLRENEVPT